MTLEKVFLKMCKALQRELDQCALLALQFYQLRFYPVLCSVRIFLVTGSMSRGLESSWIQNPGDPVNWLHWSSIRHHPLSLHRRKASQSEEDQTIFRPIAADCKLQSLMINPGSGIHWRRRLILLEPLYLRLLYPAVDYIIHLQSSDHCCSEDIGVVLAGKIESIDLFVIPPLVEGGRCLVVFQPF